MKNVPKYPEKELWEKELHQKKLSSGVFFSEMKICNKEFQDEVL